MSRAMASVLLSVAAVVLAGAVDEHGLDVGEPANAQGPELASVPGVLDAAEREPRVRGDHRVDERLPRLDLVDEAALFARVVRPDAAAKPIDGVVGERDGVVQ